MEKLYLSTLENGFLIESNSTILEDLSLEIGNISIILDHPTNNQWIISIEAMQKYLKPNIETKAYIYYGKSHDQISIENFEVITDSTGLNLRNKNQDISLYLSLDGYIRIICNQPPSSKAYLKEAVITSIDQKSDYLQITLEIGTLLLKAKNIDLIITNRKDHTEYTVKGEILDTIKIQTNRYLSKVICRFPPSIVFFKLMPHFSFLEYNMDIFDYWVRIQIRESPVTNYKFRLKGPSILPKSMWFTGNNTDNMLTISWYTTDSGYTSNRIGVISNESYQLLEHSEDIYSEEIISKKPIVLIIEYPHKAQDNGYYFFKYLMENQNEVNAFFIVSEESPDLYLLDKYKENIVFYKSPKHVQLFNAASVIAHTHSPNYVLPVYNDETLSKLKNIKKLFLQHGISGFRNMEYLYGRKSNPDLIDLFIVSSPREFKVVHEEFFYPNSDIKIAGFSRFDSLLSNNNILTRWKNRKKILIMPSWRNGQENLSDEEFLKTTFYTTFNSLINSSELHNMAIKNKLSINLYLHNNFQKYNHLFQSNFVTVLSAEDVTVHDLLKKSGILITDFSSVGLDFAIQRKSVLYYRFPNDKEDQEELTRADEFLPGPILKTETELIHAIKSKIRNNILNRKYRKMIKQDIYSFNDCHASQRIFQQLLHLIDKNNYILKK